MWRKAEKARKENMGIDKNSKCLTIFFGNKKDKVTFFISTFKNNKKGESIDR